MKIINITLRILISLALLAYFLFHNDIRAIFSTFAQVSIGMTIFVIFLNLTSLLVSTYKWQILLKKQRFLDLYKLTMISQFYNLVLFGQFSGEAIKTLKYYRGAGDKKNAIASVFFDRVTALTGMLVLGVVGAIFSKTLSNKVLVVYFVIFAILLFALMLALPLIINRNRIKRIHHKKIGALLGNFVESIAQFKKRPWLIVKSLLLGITFQLICSTVMWLLAHDLGIALNYIDIFWISSILSIAIFLPISIAGIGVREGTLIGLLGLFSISNDKAMALSLLLFAVQISGGIIGAIFEILDNKH